MVVWTGVSARTGEGCSVEGERGREGEGERGRNAHASLCGGAAARPPRTLSPKSPRKPPLSRSPRAPVHHVIVRVAADLGAVALGARPRVVAKGRAHPPLARVVAQRVRGYRVAVVQRQRSGYRDQLVPAKGVRHPRRHLPGAHQHLFKARLPAGHRKVVEEAAAEVAQVEQHQQQLQDGDDGHDGVQVVLPHVFLWFCFVLFCFVLF